MIVIGFGEYKNYKLEEIPDEFLAALAKAYSLSHSAHETSGKTELRATIAVHEEVLRRANGGRVQKRLMSRKEIATKLVNTGFRSMSKEHHPDRAGGDLETQKVLAAVRDSLADACKKIAEPEYEGAFVIPDPEPFSVELSDDDIPF
jgi:hypothetical protein